ncbi:Dabb family protein [Sphingomonas solaris]|uniref:Dabb family protein n=1 Tax=Alterirhizorhabdus solaris TaxID=2529389 RepID=A0A558RBM6_9SPHN|nr:Dabb family protein [Sphingomonas solaris]TVV76738.1 Dabb family protein [Sphingomonas solaris]
MPAITLALVTARAGADRTALRARLSIRSRACGAAGVLLGEAMPPNIDGGDLVWRLHFTDRAAWADASLTLADDADVAHVDWAAFEPIGAGARAGAIPGGIYRQMTMYVPPETPPATVARFETETLGLADAIPEIRRWSLGRVFASGGDRAWTHVWEQTFAAAEDFTGPYMNHPWHWSLVDRWFDPEMPERIVDRRLCNSLCALPDGPIGWP